MDLNGDGKMDILSGSYAANGVNPMAGHFQVLWGQADGSFKKAVALKGTDGKALVISIPNDVKKSDEDLWQICTRPTAVDWDADGKLDLVAGNFLGSFVWFKGTGSGKFSPKSEAILLNGKPLRLQDSQHSDPVIVDWDNDGDLDLLSGTGSGGVQWAENTAGKGKPVKLNAFKDLIKGNAMGDGFPSLQGDEITRGSSSRIWVSDVNGDGKLDITLGDTSDGLVPNPDLGKDKAKAEFAVWKKKMDALNAKSKKEKMDEDAYFKVYENLMGELEMIASFAGSGHVWLYLQK